MKLRLLATCLLVATVVAAGVSSPKFNRYAAAGDLPTGALVYVQIADLPAFIRLWTESSIGAKFLAGESFKELKERHLALKLASRWQEFSDGLGFPLDLEAVSGFANDRAAAAIYDVGKLEMVFVAPISDEAFAAMMLMQNADKFETEEVKGSTIYRVAIDADRGRQKQEVLFANVKGRLIVATSARLLARTIANVTGASKKDRLALDPAFARLSEIVEPHLATVWLNQAALNDDYYFKKYWLMGDVADLKNMRSAMCDIAIEQGRLVERREILLVKPETTRVVTRRALEAAVSHIPEGVPFYRFTGSDPATIGKTLTTTISDDQDQTPTDDSTDTPEYSGAHDDDDSRSDGYRRLGPNYDESIDHLPVDDVPPAPGGVDLSNILASARPVSVLAFTRPEILPAPLFARFRRGAVFSLGAPAGFDRTLFEAAIRERLTNRVTIGAQHAEVEWKSKAGGAAVIRELDLPMLGWTVAYTLRGGQLFVASDADFLAEMVAGHPPKDQTAPPLNLTERVSLDLAGAESTYNGIFERLAGKDTKGNFFTGNVRSVIDLFSNVKKIEFDQGRSRDLIHEKITFYLDKTTGG